MTDKEAMKLALKALELLVRPHGGTVAVHADNELVIKARTSITALREALVEPQEKYTYGTPLLDAMTGKAEQPAQRKPLTDEQIYDMYNEPRSDAEMLEFARAIEAAHGIKGDA